MKNFDFKKLLVFIAIIVALVLIIFGLFKTFKKDGVNKDDLSKIEENIKSYYSKLTYGYNTTFNGIDILYKNDKTVLDDINPNNILKTAIRYASDKGLGIQINNNTLKALIASNKYGKEGQFVAYNAKGVREAAKILFGKEFPNQNAPSNFTFLSEYFYDKEHDVYIEKKSKLESNVDMKQSVNVEIEETKKEKDKIISTVTIAYVLNENGKRTYAKDFRGQNIIAKDVTELNKDQKAKLDKYKFTLRKSEADESNYVFESVEKVK